MRIRRVVGIVSLCALGLAVARLSFAYYRFHAVARDFDSIHEGDSREAVLRTLGYPNYHSGTCLEDLHVANDCASELVYADPFAPWLPEYYVVDFSPQDRVVAATRLISP